MKPIIIKTFNHIFMISQSPNNDNILDYIKLLQHYHIHKVVRVCVPTYNHDTFDVNQIRTIDLLIADGQTPNPVIIQQWLRLIENQSSIAIHCQAGLGRAPTLIAITLIENGYEPTDAVDHIRRKIPHAFNTKQLDFILNYIPTKSQIKRCCQIM